ncbi:SDR family NAD(P)-dependent oxidoreductase [Kineococcus arenarius]|uniref:SDR family NAD(P)-dependent oxidoreductase n=1 Tax=Kineococcus sp. SYSU DK007 TaxID=3383128 RepID=UPI003D7F0EC1
MRAANEVVGGRTALVTGAGNGLGRAIALALAGHGARVVLVGRREGPLRETAATIGPMARVATCDVSDPASVDALAGELADEQISILVNNAGVPGPVADLTAVQPHEWDEVFAVNVRGTYLVCRASLPPMLQRRAGDVVNIASVSGKRPLPGRTPYTASKMAVLGLTSTLATEVGPLGVMVNSVSPGPVAGPRMARNFAREAERTGTTPAQAEAAFVSRAALRRMVTEEEVATATVAALCMPGLCGADIDLSAGMVAR